MAMNPEVKRQWVKALRSGKYKQGTGQLRNNLDEFCCLGVLCNLHAAAHPELAQKETDPQIYLGDMSFPSLEVLEWAGLDDDDPYVTTVHRNRASLAQLNDGTGTGNGNNRKHSFKEIASLIEASL